jgi:hypothetical protein
MKQFIYCFIFLMLVSSCVNFTNMQSARTLGEGRTKDHYIYTRLTIPVVEGEVEGGLPTAEYVYKHKIKNNFDWGLKVGLDANVTGNVKYQFVGDSRSKFAMSVMPETGLGFFPNDKDSSSLHNAPLVWRSELPLIASYHFSDYFYISVIPKILNYYTPQGHFTMLAGSSGIQFGKKVNVTLAYSYFYIANRPPSIALTGDVGHVFEFGLKFNLFHNDRVFAPRFSFD